MFSKNEQIEILKHLGYNIVKEEDVSRKSKIYGGSIEYVDLNGEKVEIEDVFKSEIKKRLFNI